MTRGRVAWALLVAALASACSPEPASDTADGTWVGTITTEGNVTTVVNESGSVWGGTARLVEEASIGVDVGAEEYMFGRISSVYFAGDRIYVVDGQVPAVRVYDHAGTFLRTLGGQGQGPGEYVRPALVAADAEGRAFVLDVGNQRVNVYTDRGESADTWAASSRGCCVWPMFPLATGALWFPVGVLGENDMPMKRGLQIVGPSGPQGDVLWPPDIEYDQVTYDVSGHEHVAPFSPWLVWSPTVAGGVVAGASDSYRYEVHRPDSAQLVVERYWEPVPVLPGHREWERRFWIAFQRQYNQPDFAWDGAEIPDHKPAYSLLIPALSGETWVYREGVSERLANCAEDPIEAGYQAAVESRCWSAGSILDAFGDDGRYLGEVELPLGLLPNSTTLSVEGRRVVGVFQDPQGTYMVKRYRLVLPGEARKPTW